MGRKASLALAATFVVANGLGCGGRIVGVQVSNPGETSTVAALEQGAVVSRAFVGATNDFELGEAPLVAAFDLLGGAQVELEVVTRDASPLSFELWQAHVDGTTTLKDPVEANSGFAIERIRADEDARWVIVFPTAVQGVHALVRIDCAGSVRGCTPERQPGESCPAGWSCDQGLECALPVGACGPLGAPGTCIVPPPACEADPAGAVCGCDGRTYASQCAARAAYAPILRWGACEG